MSAIPLARSTAKLHRLSVPTCFEPSAGRRVAPRAGHNAGRPDDAEEVRVRGEELEEAHARLDAALNSMAHGLLMLDADLSVVMCNRPLRELLNFDPDIVRPGAAMHEVLAHSIAVGNHPGRSLEQVVADIRRLARAGQRTSLCWNLPGGRVLAVRWEPIESGGWVCIYEDVTVREAATARAVHLACHDAVTDLPNRRALLDAMQIAWPQPDQYPFSLLCLEIDRFQSICDTRGHSTCDRLLQEVADRLGSCVRRGDMVAHLGGASFAILLTAPGSAELAQRFATRLIEALRAPVVNDGRSLLASVSIGIAMPDGAQDGPSDVLRNATLAMHRAAAKGGGQAKHYAPHMDRQAQAQHELELDLRAALEAGQFEMHYQPLVSVSDRVVTGFEALLRWRHPVRGMVSPAEFIPLAEELGLIGPIGEWVLRTACAEAAGWPGQVRVAVNLSPEQFTGSAAGNLAAMVGDILAETGLPGTRLELEITESVQLQEDAATLDMLHALRRLGARISLDDFGTGYSSLSYLRCFPFDKIKIDQSFVRGLPSAESMAIVRAVTALGASLGIATVAEGVETELQLKALVAASCDEMQGYLFSRPRPAGEVPGLIAAAASRMAA
jgi:diguanylate cyclase (GGDEF)-like protein